MRCAWLQPGFTESGIILAPMKEGLVSHPHQGFDSQYVLAPNRSDNSRHTVTARRVRTPARPRAGWNIVPPFVTPSPLRARLRHNGRTKLRKAFVRTQTCKGDFHA